MQHLSLQLQETVIQKDFFSLSLLVLTTVPSDMGSQDNKVLPFLTRLNLLHNVGDVSCIVGTVGPVVVCPGYSTRFGKKIIEEREMP